MCESGDVRSQGVIRIKVVEFTRLIMYIQIWPCREKVQHRKDGISLSAVWKEGTTQGKWRLSLQLSV